MNDLIATGAIYIGGYLTTKYVVNYAINKATEKAIEGTWSLSKKAANVAIDHLIKRENEEKCEYLDYELVEIDPEDRDIVRVINVIELPPNNEVITPHFRPFKPQQAMIRENISISSISSDNEEIFVERMPELDLNESLLINE